MSKYDLIDTYKSMLAFVGYSVTDDGFVRQEFGPGIDPMPALGKDGAPMVLPTPERLDDDDINQHAVFHILSENTRLKESEVLSKYRHWMITHFNVVMGVVGEYMLKVAASKSAQNNMTSDRLRFLELIEEVDEDTIKIFSKLADKASIATQMNEKFITSYVSPAEVLNGKSYMRVATVTFPFYKDLTALAEKKEEYDNAPKKKKPAKVDKEVYGVKLRNNDIPALIGLMKAMVPNIDVENEYSVGSNNRIAPSAVAVLSSFRPLAERLNLLIEQLKHALPEEDAELEACMFDLNWVDAIDNLDEMQLQIRRAPQSHKPIPEGKESKDNRPEDRVSSSRNRPAPWEDEDPRESRSRQDNRDHRDTRRDHRDDRDNRYSRDRDERPRREERDDRSRDRGGNKREVSIAETFGRGRGRDSRDERGYDRGRDDRDRDDRYSRDSRDDRYGRRDDRYSNRGRGRY